MYLCIIKISSIFDVPVFPLGDGIPFHVLHTLSSGTLSKNESCYGLSYETQLWYDDGSRTYSEALRHSLLMERDSNCNEIIL